MRLVSKEAHELYLKNEEKHEYVRIYSNGTTLKLERKITYLSGAPRLFDWKNEYKTEEKYYLNNVEIDEELYEHLRNTLPDWNGDEEETEEADETTTSDDKKPLDMYSSWEEALEDF